MIKLSAFADEISPDLEAEMDVIIECGLGMIDLRGFDSINVLDLDGARISKAKEVLARRKVSVNAIASPIGKSPVTDPAAKEEDRVRKALALAADFSAPFIRIFSYYIPKGDDPAKWRKTVLERVGSWARMAEREGVMLHLENEEGLYGETVERCVDLVASVNSPALEFLFDPCNLAVIGGQPHSVLGLARPHMKAMHVKDYSRAHKAMTPAGEGDSGWEPILKDLGAWGWDGPITLEPHLAAAGRMSGFSGPELFREAHRAFAEMLARAGLDSR